MMLRVIEAIVSNMVSIVAKVGHKVSLSYRNSCPGLVSLERKNRLWYAFERSLAPATELGGYEQFSTHV
jgi:hypothetical protein